MTATSTYLNRPLRAHADAETELENGLALDAARLLSDCAGVADMCDVWDLDCIGEGAGNGRRSFARRGWE